MSQDSNNDDATAGLAPADPRLQALAGWTEPTDAEVHRVLSRRVTRVDARRMDAAAAATEPTWVDEQRLHTKAMAAAPTDRDPRSRAWALATSPTDAEVARISPEAPHPELAEVTRPTDDELHRLVHGAMPAAWRTYTEPSDDEVRRLCARRAELQASAGRYRRHQRLIGGLVLAGAAAVALLIVGALALLPVDDGYGTPELAVGSTTVLQPGDDVDLGPSIDMAAHRIAGIDTPTVRVDQADADGTIIQVLSGGTRFEVDPTGTHRHLTVLAGDVEVVVKGTVFTVDALPDAVLVGVERGRVQVTSPTGRIMLTKGQRWRSDAGLLGSATPEPAATVAASAAVPPVEVAPAGEGDDAIADGSAEATPPGARDAASDQTTALVAPSPVRAAPVRAVPPGPVPLAPGSTEPAPSSTGPALDWPPTTAAPALAQRAPEPSADGSADAPSDAASKARAEALGDAFQHLQALRERNNHKEAAHVLLRDVERFVDAGLDPRLRIVAAELRVDIAQRVADPGVFDASVAALSLHNARHPRLGALHLESGARWEQAGETNRAIRAYELAARSRGELGLRGLLALSRVAMASGDDVTARQALEQAQSRISEAPALRSEIEPLRQALEER